MLLNIIYICLERFNFYSLNVWNFKSNNVVFKMFYSYKLITRSRILAYITFFNICNATEEFITSVLRSVENKRKPFVSFLYLNIMLYYTKNLLDFLIFTITFFKIYKRHKHLQNNLFYGLGINWYNCIIVFTVGVLINILYRYTVVYSKYFYL